MGLETMEDRSIGQILLEYTQLTPQQLEEALVVQREKGLKLGEALITLRFLRPEDVLRGLSIQVGIPYVNEINPEEVPTDLVNQVPINFAKKMSSFP